MFKAAASVLGIGYIKGGGTVAAAVCALALYLAAPAGLHWQPGPALLGTLLLLAGGTWVAQRVEADWGHDSSRVVIDEVAGMWMGVLLLPLSPTRLLLGLVLFRFFDIVKPLGIRRLERLPGGWGVMLDDVLAGIYTNLLLQAGSHFSLF